LSLLPAGSALLMLSANPDWRILLFAIGLSLLTGLIFGLTPALKSTRLDLWSTLKDAAGSTTVAGGSVRLRKGLVTAQVALSFLLLFGAGLFVQSLQNLKGQDSGYKDIENLISFQLDPTLNGYSVPRMKQFYQELLDNLRAQPGVQSAGYARAAVLAEGASSGTRLCSSARTCGVTTVGRAYRVPPCTTRWPTSTSCASPYMDPNHAASASSALKPLHTLASSF
jgi:hypothetical protein